MTPKATKLEAERVGAYQRLRMAYRDMQIADEVMRKYEAFSPPRPVSKQQGGETIYRRARDAWSAATQQFTDATADFMAATELLNSIGRK